MTNIIEQINKEFDEKFVNEIQRNQKYPYKKKIIRTRVIH